MFTTGTAPVRHLVWDNFVTPRADWIVPPPEWGGWEARYDGELERNKRATRALPEWGRALIEKVLAPDVLRACVNLFGTSLEADPDLWGGGLQVTSGGGHLNPHIDGAVHPQRPHLRRAAQMVLFCHRSWRLEYGGDFAFYSPMGNPMKWIEPTPGRLVVFENTDLAYHGVEPTAPDAPERVTLTCSLLAPVRPTDTRCRALFLPARTLRPPA